VKLPSRSDEIAGTAMLLKQVCGYGAAVILPLVGMSLGIRSHTLQITFLALSLAAIAAITTLRVVRPNIAGISSSALTCDYYAVSPVSGWWSYTTRDVMRAAAIVCIVLLAHFFFRRRRITENQLRLTVASLQQQTDALLDAQQGSDSAAWTFSVEDSRIHWAQGGADIFGQPFPEVSTVDLLLDSMLEEDRGRFESTFERALRKCEAFCVDFRVKWSNGEVHWLESRGKPSQANPRVWGGATIDVTDRKNAEFALMRSEMRAAINRLLESVTNLIYLASADPLLLPPTKYQLKDANQELARVASAARHILAFARPKVSSPPADVAEVVEGVIAAFQPRCRSRGGEICFVQKLNLSLAVPPDDLRQILANIVSNACDALPETDGIVEVGVLELERAAAIQIRDNGVGIPRENLDRIFDPFFTTKDNLATGIGLWVTKELVEKSGGRISVHIDNLPLGFRTMFQVEFRLA
jgi:PAS domain S-box-containing protein